MPEAAQLSIHGTNRYFGLELVIFVDHGFQEILKA